MFDRERRLYAFALEYAGLLAADLDDAALAEQPMPGMNHPAWILGHLALCTDYARGLLGLPTACPPEWSALFGPGSEPKADRAAYPGKAELLAALGRGHAEVSAAAASADPARLDAPHPVAIAFLKGRVDTVGELLAHLMTTHEAVHLGQLSAWRRARGMSGVLTL